MLTFRLERLLGLLDDPHAAGSGREPAVVRVVTC